MKNKDKILRSPFNIEVHKKTFINYLEVVILEDGTIEYAVPSHQEKIIKIAMERYKKTREEILDMCPVEYHADFMNWLCMVTKTVSLWKNFLVGVPNKFQLDSIHDLIDSGLYRGEVNTK